ncbi:hypothetical protein [Paraburkholderia sp. BL25I1N1]|uniref:hypothetical protein n=1 Tax=Paraburkholderia sp. BL25I1N1 TaxID=1938804 RepID=UPI00215900BE|nr:hypothetical protein [Paraburkholderia sp. BL25I1N1]
MTDLPSSINVYAYRTLVWDIYVERVVSTRDGRLANEQKIAAALPRAAVCLAKLKGAKAVAQVVDVLR